MVNKGQILKINLEHELNEKILKAEDVLEKLNLAYVETKICSNSAKNDVEERVDDLNQQLISRKAELVKQIEFVTENQIRNIQEGINAAYLSIGSLKSTLNNLENIDQSQIRNIKLPDLSWIENIQIPSGLEVANISTHNVEKEINDWGKVGAEGIGPSFLCDGKREMCLESISSSMSEEYELVFDDELSKMVATEKINTGDSKVAFSNENDPISMEIEQKDDLSKWLKPKEKRFKSLAQNDLMNLMKIQSDNDLSKWLKPKEMKKTPTAAAEVDTNKVKMKILEFPTLQMSPDSWILRKNSKNICSNIQNITSNYQKVCGRVNFDHNAIVPPQYALPYPLWLKKKAY